MIPCKLKHVLVLLAIALGIATTIAFADGKKSAANSTPPAPEAISAEDAQAFETLARDAELLAAKAEAARLKAELARSQIAQKYRLVDGDSVDPKTRAITRKAGGK